MELATAAKAASVAVKNKDKIGKILVFLILLLFTGYLLMTTAFFYIMSAFIPDGILRSADYFDGGASTVYSSIKEISDPFYEELEQEMQDRREELIEKHTYEYESVDDDGKKIKIKNVPKVSICINYVPESLIIAYLMQTDGIDTKTAVINQKKTKKFLKEICVIQEVDKRDNQFLLETQILAEDQIADQYFTTEITKQTFQVMCDAYSNYFDIAETKIISDEGEITSGNIFDQVLTEVPLYLQYDAKWGGIPYGNETIKKTGCCPTCLAMVFSYYCQREILPNDITAWAGNRYYVNGAGTAWSIFEPAGRNWNVKCANIGKNQNQMIEALKSGKLIIASMGPGTFTTGGHFIVLTGITRNGKIRVNDPNDNSRKQHIRKEFDISLILRESKNMWVFE